MDLEVLVVGAGVVGLACATEQLGRGRRVLVVERHAEAGRETSSRNSEVIHAGLYYPEGSLKAELCVEGRKALYRRCRQLGIPHRRIGKLVVATCPDEIPMLEKIEQRARINGAGLDGWLDAQALHREEPRVRGVAALWSPETGIVDAHALVASYQAELEAAGVSLAFHTRVVGLEPLARGWRVHTQSGDDEPFAIDTAVVVNAAGLGADRIAEQAGIDVDRLGYRQRPCKGDYFSVAPSLGALTRHLVYPVPVPGGLGTHVTMDLGGRYRLGPDVEYVPEPRYDVDPGKAKVFAEAVARYLPEIGPEDLSPDFAGIRPKLQAPREGFRDYVIEEATPHGAPGLINLLGIESPGLTSAPAIARRVAGQVDRALEA